MKHTLHIAHIEGELPRDFTQTVWMPWINCDPAQDELTKRMALSRHLRERGGIAPGESLTVFQCIRTTMDTPCVVDYTEYKLTNDAENERRPNADYLNVLRG